MNNERVLSIPEMLGFLGTDSNRREFHEREKPYSVLSYRTMYLLYEDEAEELVGRYDSHSAIDMELHQRYAAGGEYRERVKGGYPAMERKMRKAGLIPQEEMEAVDQLNAQEQGAPTSPGTPIQVEGFTTPHSILGEGAFATFRATPRRLVEALGERDARAMIDAALEDDGLQEWLDDCLQADDNDLASKRFHLNDVPEREREPIMRMLAGRWIEWKMGLSP